MNVFVFDIETVPDIETGKRILGLEPLSDKEIANAMLSLAKESTGQAFVKHHLQKIVAISAVFRQGDTLKIWSLGESTQGEGELIRRFFSGIDKYIPTLVSWNGSGFDLPVLHYRALYHGISGLGYWDQGDKEPSFKYNNYLNRYHTRHIDLMDTLAQFQQRAFAKLEDIALLLGLPGKMGMAGDQVLDYYLRGDIASIRHYCETDVLNTYLIYLRFQLMRGNLSRQQYASEIDLTKEVLKTSEAEHLKQFLASWNKITCHAKKENQ